jgi:hypothetical protein
LVDPDRQERKIEEHAVEQRAGVRLAANRSTARFWASAAENHAAQLVAKALGFLRVGGAAKAHGEFEELPLTFSRLDAASRDLARRTHNINMHEKPAIL